jgi:hypothetical protein
MPALYSLVSLEPNIRANRVEILDDGYATSRFDC